MKNIRKKIISSCLAVSLIVGNLSFTTFAKEYSLGEAVVEGDFESDFEINLTDACEILTEYKQDSKEIAIQEEKGIMTLSEEVQEADGSDEVSKIYYGTVTGTLSATGDYVLYPVSLSANQYLQLKLTLPSDKTTDYDLLLYDGNLSLIKYSDYLTCTTTEETLEESIGYLADTDERLYVCVYSSLGGNTTDEYILDYTITTNFSESTEPDETAGEATSLSLSETGATVQGRINSPLDNDWYIFEVLDDAAYNKMRLTVSSSSETNGCQMELYKNAATNANYFGMQKLGAGTGVELKLSAGIYYLRIVSTNTVDDFNAGDIPDYKLSVVPVSKVTKIEVTNFKGKNSAFVPYPEGKFIRIDRADVNVVTVCGCATYVDSDGETKGAANVILKGEVVDTEWLKISRPDMAYASGSAVTNEDGNFSMQIYLMPPLGGRTYKSPVSTHYYDLMETTVSVDGDSSVSGVNCFYYLRMSALD